MFPSHPPFFWRGAKPAVDQSRRALGCQSPGKSQKVYNSARCRGNPGVKLVLAPAIRLRGAHGRSGKVLFGHRLRAHPKRCRVLARHPGCGNSSSRKCDRALRAKGGLLQPSSPAVVAAARFRSAVAVSGKSGKLRSSNPRRRRFSTTAAKWVWAERPRPSSQF